MASGGLESRDKLLVAVFDMRDASVVLFLDRKRDIRFEMDKRRSDVMALEPSRASFMWSSRVRTDELFSYGKS